MSETKNKAPGWLKSTMQRWLGTPISLTDGEFWAAYAGQGAANGKPVTVDSALQLSTVWACVRLISETISTLPLGFYEKMPDGSRKSATEHPLYELLHNQPNAEMTAVQFWQAVISSMLLWGNAYIEKARIGKKIVALNFLLPSRISKRRLANGSIEYKYKEPGGKERIISERDLVNIPAFTLDGVNGLTPMSYGGRVFGSAAATEEASSRVFSSGMRAAGIMKMTGNISPEQREALRRNVNQFTAGGQNAGTVMVLENGAEFEAISMNPVDTQMIESKEFAVAELCRWFRVPPSMIGHGGAASNWGTGIEQQMIGFLTFSLRPWLTRVEQAIRKDLLEPAERQKFFASFNIEGLLRADSASRASFYATMTANGIYTSNYCRSLENLPPLDGGDELRVQSNMIPLSMLGKITSTAGAAKSAVLNWLGIAPDGEKDEA